MCRKILSILINIVIISTSLAQQSLNVICNSNIITFNDTTRDITKSSTSYKCDSAVIPGFYSFGPDKYLPSFCPISDACSSDAPLWTSEAQPNATAPGPITINLCASTSTTGTDTDCRFDCSTNVLAAYCGNINSIVYYFSSVKICNERYCFETAPKPCGANESSITGRQPCQATFPFDQLKNGTTTYATSFTDANIQGTALKCLFYCPANLNCSGLSGAVYWYTKGSLQLIKQTNLITNGTVLYSFLQESEWTPFINRYFYCAMTPMFNSFRPYQSLYTQYFYAGLYLKINDSNSLSNVYNFFDQSQITLQLTEATGSTHLIVYTNLPILCNTPNSNTCPLKIQLAKETIYPLIRGSNSFQTTFIHNQGDGCAQYLKSLVTPDPNNTASWLIVASVADKNIQDASTIRISLFVKSSIKIIGTYWENLFLPLIDIYYIPKNLPVVTAHSQNDPHMRSHDGTNFEFQVGGEEYLMLENKDSLLWIHAINTGCCTLYGYWCGAYCNDRIYIQSIDDVVYHDVRYPSILFYQDLSGRAPAVQLLFDPSTGFAKIPKKTAFRITYTGGVFSIFTHFATIINIVASSGNYYVYPSKFDYGRIYGILGNYNANPSDDLTNTACGTVTSTQQYFNCYKISNPTFNRRKMSLNQFYDYTSNNSASNYTQYCQCVSNTGEATINCPLGLLQDPGKSATYSKRQYKEDSTEPPITFKTLEIVTNKFKLYDNNEINYKTIIENARKKRSVTSSCASTLNISIFQECYRQNLVDLPQLISNCEFDFNITGADVWSDGYYKTALNTCRRKLVADKTNFISGINGTKVPQVTFLAKLCPSNCSNHGNCSNGQCICYLPFDGFDCSIDMTSPITIYYALSLNNVCDLKNESDSCSDLVLLVSRTSSMLRISYSIKYKQSNGSFQNFETSNSNSFVFVTKDNYLYSKLYNFEQIPSGSMSVLYYNITVMDNATSNPIIYTVYNGDCHECTSSLNCTVKSNKCDIDTVCYSMNDVNPTNKDQFCNPSKSSLAWTSLSNKAPRNYSINSFIVCTLILFLSKFF